MVEDDQNFILECSSRAFSSSDTDGLCKEELDPLEHYTVKDEVDTETPYDEQYYLENNAESTKCVWLDSTTEFLLSLVEEFFPKVGKTFSLHTKKKMWQAVRSRMEEEGYIFTVAQVESKFRTLERQYKKTMRRNKQTGLKQTCPFQQKIESILSCRKGVFSKCLQEEYRSSGFSKVGTMEQEELEELPLQAAAAKDALSNPNLSFVQSDDDSISQAPKKKPTIAVTILKELQESRAERQAFHTKVLQYLQNKEERDERMEERAERKEEREVRKIELLEKLVRMKGREGSN